jgi:hypothetical protein
MCIYPFGLTLKNDMLRYDFLQVDDSNFFLNKTLFFEIRMVGGEEGSGL